MDAVVDVDVGARIGDVAVVAHAVGRPAVDTAADVVAEGEVAPVDTATAAAAVAAGAGLSPRWTRRDLLFFCADDDDEEVDGGLMGDADEILPFEGGGVVGDVVSVVVGVDRVGTNGAFDTAAAVDFRLHDGYPAIAQLVASSSAFFIVASVDEADLDVGAGSS